MSWEAMEVSMSKTRRGKYTESDICVFTQVQYVVCLPIRFFTYSSNCSYPMRGKSFSFYRGKIGGSWDVSMGFMDLEFDPDKVKCTVDDFDMGNEGVNALVKMVLNDPEAKRQMVEAFKSEMDFGDFNGSLDIEFDGDNVMKLTGDDGVVLTFHRQ